MGFDFGGEEETAKFGNGLVVKSFEAIPATVFEDDQADLILRIQNKGEPVAREVKAYLYSFGDLAVDSNSPNTQFVSDVGKLDPPTDQFEGELKDIEWTMDTTGMDLAGTQKEVANCYARIYYKYNTSAKVSVPVLSKDEYKKRVERDESLPSMGAVAVTHGPFAVEVNSRSPVLVEQNDDKFKVYIIAENLAGGTPYHVNGHPTGTGGDSPSTTPTEDQLETIQMKVDAGNNAQVLTCDGDPGWGSFKDVSIRRGEKARLGCEIQVTNTDVPRQDIPITAVMRYGYYKDTSVQVTVEGQA